MDHINELKVFITAKESTCDECGEKLDHHAWITLRHEKGALCLSCADLDQLVFLPSGNSALTRRSRNHSILCAVVLKWSRARKRYERQGLLVEEHALRQAEQECLDDHEFRERRREREVERRVNLDHEYVQMFAKRVREIFPRCPSGREHTIAEHACLKYSGRIGRTAVAKHLAEQAIQLAVIAHIRHAETPYEHLLANGRDRWESRLQVEDKVNQILLLWRNPE